MQNWKAIILTASVFACASSVLADGKILTMISEGGGSGSIGNSFKINLGSDIWQIDHDGYAVNASFIDGNDFVLGLLSQDGNLEIQPPVDWDGILLQSQGSYVSIYHRADVKIGEQSYDIREFNPERVNLGGEDALKPEDVAFMDAIENENVSFVQLPLVIYNGTVDVREVEGAQIAIRRFAFENENGSMGIYQTHNPMTLYEATKELLELNSKEFGEQRVATAVSLPMGEHDYCMNWGFLNVAPCGTNLKEHEPKMILSITNSMP